MTKPRKHLIDAATTPYYHIVSRCVRRSFLCGIDKQGNNFEHRRQWIEEKILALPHIFAIHVCAYAVMSNHYHLVLEIDKAQSEVWTTEEVIERWHRLFKGNLFSQRFMRGEPLSCAERGVLDNCVSVWRSRLADISWFMRQINEPIAREANAEDNCTGRFWEGRFKSQALLDEKALTACMAYVDLNPIRAKMAKTPEQSHYTSAQRRIHKAKRAHNPNHSQQQARSLRPFVGNPRQDMPAGLPFRLTDYLELLDWTGKQVRANKRGAISAELPPILERLAIDPKHWLYSATQFESRFKGLVGGVYKLKQACKKLGYQRTPGLGSCRLLN
ncbi:transposase [Simiduia aestuariiviva]|uniref:REP element-mobilizing transposase RayT n=1 Tax=Simiduia aestuariiviva TaxID=1510459 RepID=A0A839UQT5_9GAMM|nr:transposase [Simiduia aestuariiviva]MBB3167908.1 REP element-mobilizing transposase RayT [Simiduia aestuariiviva]